MYYKISRLVLTPTSGKPSTTADVFVSNPQIDQEALLGKLFFICEIESTKPAAFKIINFFISTLPTYYYQHNKISLKEKMGRININEIFESTLARVNADFEKFLKKEKIKIEGKKLNMTTGVVSKGDLIFSTIGTIKATLIHAEKPQEKDEQLGKKVYKITPIDEEGVAPKKIDFSKVFSHVVEGKIPPESYFIFTNEILPEYINSRHLSKIITTLPSISAIEQLKSQLHKINSYVSFIGLIIKNSTTPQIKRSIPKMNININANNSLEQMQATEQDAAKYLSPTGTVSSQRLLSFVKKYTIDLFRQRQSNVISTRARSTIRDKIFITRKSPWRWLLKLSYHLKNIIYLLTNITLQGLKALAHPRELARKIIDSSRNAYTTAIQSLIQSVRWFIHLSTISKVWLITFIICSSLFAYSIYYVSHTKTKNIAEASYQETIQLIKQKQNQIEASLLYHDEDKAKQLITETEELLSAIQNYSDVDSRLLDVLTTKNIEQLEKISHVILTTPKELANLAKLNQTVQPAHFVAIDDLIITADPINKTLYQLNINNNSASVWQENIAPINFSANITEDEAILISADGAVRIDAEGIMSPVSDKITNSLDDITDITSYNGRLYVLSTINNNIYRYASNYQSRQDWIKEEIDVKNAVSIGIDGYIYLLQNNGEILRMLSGYTNKFELSEVNPAFSNPTKMKLVGDSDDGFIYILEPSNQRIVMFNKEGKFLLQYRFDNLPDVKDFIILDNKILLLNGQSIYEIEMKEL
ncbi:MAG: hypothetical protein ABIH48_02765 [Candidatus Falkowbacteria bacterium]